MNALPGLPIVLFVTALAAACESAPEHPSVTQPEVTGFSGLRPDETIPAAWQSWSLSRFKQPSRYKLIEDAGSTVVHARAQTSAFPE